ncbi:MAG: cbb3-type cytochrome c oxidase subunit 3 [Pseudomonadales bacterium]
MDLNTVRGLITLALLILFIWLIAWAYSKKRKQTFTDAANLPFADEAIADRSKQQAAQTTTNTRTGDVE